MNNKKIQKMKIRVYNANLELPKLGLVKLTWGNVSEINRELKVVAIKPSGVNYKTMTIDDIVLTDLDGKKIDENSLNPSSDLKTHVELYKAFKEINSVVHTHSRNAVAWAQTGRDCMVYGTTHADTFYGPIPNTRKLTYEEVEEDYEKNTGKIIIERFKEKNIDPLAVPGVLVNGHGPFTWGETSREAVDNSLILDEVCLMAEKTELLNKKPNTLPEYIVNKHYFRKHGKDAYYGQ